MAREHNHYFKDVKAYDFVDVYRVLQLFGVTDPCLQHAIKKLLVAGGRGHKNINKDVHEAIVSLQRWQEMQAEDSNLEALKNTLCQLDALSAREFTVLYEPKVVGLLGKQKAGNVQAHAITADEAIRMARQIVGQTTNTDPDGYTWEARPVDVKEQVPVN